MSIYGPKFWNLGGAEKKLNFLTSQKLALFGPANGQLVTYPKIQTKVCRLPSGTPMDWFLMKSVNAEYPLSCCNCVEDQTLCSLTPARPPKCVTPPPKCYHHIAQGPAHLKAPEYFKAPSLLHQEKIDFLKAANFDKSTQTALESPKIDMCQNWPKRILGYVISCLESKFDKRIKMRSVPNCQKEIANHDAIRWFKCKLKPPKKAWCKCKKGEKGWEGWKEWKRHEGQKGCGGWKGHKGQEG